MPAFYSITGSVRLVAEEASESALPAMLNALAARLFVVPLVFVVAAFALMAPLLATPADAFEIEKQDWGGEETRPEDLPKEYHHILRCAEAGDTDCQVMMAQVWAGEDNGEVWNGNEYGRWAQMAALRGHRGGIAMFRSYLCAIAPRYSQSSKRYAIEAIAWTYVLDLALNRNPKEITRTCSAIFLMTDERPDDLPALLEAGERRAEELRQEIPQPWHGEDRHFFWD